MDKEIKPLLDSCGLDITQLSLGFGERSILIAMDKIYKKIEQLDAKVESIKKKLDSDS